MSGAGQRDTGANRGGVRTTGREIALKFLFGADLRRHWEIADFETMVAQQGERGPSVGFARELVQGVIFSQREIDDTIQRFSPNWTLERMAVVDRNVLRLGCWELLHAPDVPAGVAINEAVDLAKRFGGANSGAFVNGLLDQVRSASISAVPKKES